MSDDRAPSQTGEKRSDIPFATSPVQPSDTPPGVDHEKKKALAKEIDSILRGIPFIGPYIVIVKLKWGWAGILLLIVGFMIATLLVFTGFFPSSAVSEKYKQNASTSPNVSAPESRDYELKAQQDILWDAAVKNAKSRIWASGIALSKLNPQLIAEKVKEGVPVQMAYLSPCGDVIKQRMGDENNPDAAVNIKANLNKFDTFTRDFNVMQKDSLKVKLTNVYPTMVVIIIDNDLYTYFCPYGAVCSNSPVLVFKDYEKKPKSTAAKFFEDHFIAVCNNLKPISNYKDPCSSGP
ncbi:MAG TPA: hypothetical protein VIF64_03250 [Pyrinomonadaceae bacterium]|jgi:hypothetical protein